MRARPRLLTVYGVALALGLTVLPGPGTREAAQAMEGGSGGAPGSASLGHGGPCFAAGVELQTSTNPWWLASGCLRTGSGIQDLIVSEYGDSSGISSISVFLGFGDGTFEKPVTYPLDANSKPYQVVLTDLDGDGNLDVACGAAAKNEIFVLKGDGKGGLTVMPPIPTEANAVSIAVGDFQSVSRPEKHPPQIAVCDPASHKVTLYSGNLMDGSASNFSSVTGSDAGGAYKLWKPDFLVATDLDVDGKFDLAVYNGKYVNQISLLKGNGDGTFVLSDHDIGTGYRSPGYASTIAVGLLNADQRPDIVTPAGAPIYGAGIELSRAGDSMAFDDGFPNLEGGNNFACVVADFNKDGKQDLAITDVEYSGVKIYEGNGDGTFVYPLTLPTGVGPYGIAVADFNGDGWPDIATTSYTDQTLLIRLNDGKGGFLQRTDLQAGAVPKGVAKGDFNGDGVDDLAVACSKSDQVAIFLHRTKTSQDYWTGIQELTDGAVRDYRLEVDFSDNTARTEASSGGDGRVTVWADGVVSIDWPGSGLETVTVQRQGDSMMATGSLTAYNGGRIIPSRWQLKKQPSGVVQEGFYPAVYYQVGPQPIALDVGDVNGDNVPDIVTANFQYTSGGQGSVSLLLGNKDPTTGNRNGTFQPQRLITDGVGQNPIWVGLADVHTFGNSQPDGILDIITANYYWSPGTVSVLLGSMIGDAYTTNPQANSPYHSGPGVTGATFFGVNARTRQIKGLATACVSDMTVRIHLCDESRADGPAFGPNDYIAGGSADQPNPVSIEAGDIDHDGADELVTMGYGSTLQILKVKPDVDRPEGKYQFQPTSIVGRFNTRILKVEDLDGDGNADLLVGGGGPGYIPGTQYATLLRGDGNGAFEDPTTALNYECYSGPYAAVIGDFTGRGLKDIAVACAQESSLTYSTTVSVLPGQAAVTPNAPFVWQTISLADPADPVDVWGEYTVVVYAQATPPDPSTFVYPSLEHDPRLKERRIEVRSPQGLLVPPGILRRKVLAYAHNAAVYRHWLAGIGTATGGTDPCPLLDRSAYLIEGETTHRYPGVPDNPLTPTIFRGGTDTRFGAQFPGYLQFPVDYWNSSTDSVLVDWTPGMANPSLILGGLLGPLGSLYEAYGVSHPLGLSSLTQRQKIYETLLEDLVLQNGVAELGDHWRGQLVFALTQALPMLDTETAMTVKEFVQLLMDAKDLRPFTTITFSGQDLVALRDALSKAATSVGNDAITSSTGTANIIGALDIAIGFVQLGSKLGGDALAAIIYASAIQDHGAEIAAVLNDTLFADSALGPDPALWNAWADVYPAFGSANKTSFWNNVLARYDSETAAREPGYVFSAAQLGLEAAALIDPEPATKGAAIAVDIGIRTAQFAWNTYWDKVGFEERQQVVVLCGTLEHVWYTGAIAGQLTQLSPGSVSSVRLDRLNRLVSCRLYLAIDFADKVLADSDSRNLVVDLVNGLDPGRLAQRRPGFESFKAARVAEFLGRGPSFLRVAGRETDGTTGLSTDYVGFVPRAEIDTLDNLASSDEVSAMRTLRLELRAPAELGVIDPANRRIGSFVVSGASAGTTLLSEIPGATDTGLESNPRVIEIVAPLPGAYHLELAGTAEGALTLDATTFTSVVPKSTARVAGSVGPARRLDGVAMVTAAGGDLMVAFDGDLVTRGKATGICRIASSGRGIGGVAIEIAVSGAGASYTAVTGDDGRYKIDGIVPGSLFIHAHLSGFTATTQGPIALAPFGSIDSEILLWDVIDPVLDLATSAATVETGVPQYDPVARTTTFTVTLSNMTGEPIGGPLCVLFTGFDSRVFRLIGASGTSADGTSYIYFSDLVSGGTLGPGESVTRSVVFANPDGGDFTIIGQAIGRTPSVHLEVIEPLVSSDFVTHRPEILVTGVVDGVDPTAGVRFSTDRGRSGSVSGGSFWQASIALEEGVNNVGISVTGSDGNAYHRSFVVEYRPVFLECRDGLSLVAIPTVIDGGYTASALLRDLNLQGGEAKGVFTYADGGITAYLLPGSGTDFRVEVGKSYFVLGHRNNSVRWVGDALLSEPVVVPLHKGNNFIGLPVLPRAARKASGIAAEVVAQGGDVAAVSHFKDGSMEPFLPGFTANDFEIRPGDGLVIVCRKDSEWKVQR